MAKRRNLKKEKQERNRAYARKFKKRKLRNDGRGEGAGNGVTGTANNGGAADLASPSRLVEGPGGPSKPIHRKGVPGAPFFLPLPTCSSASSSPPTTGCRS